MNPPPNFFDLSFWQGFLSNALATLVGVIIGIPVALWLSRRQELSSEKEHKAKILQLFSAELYMNLKILGGIDYSTKDDMLRKCTNIQVLLKTTYWDAFTDGGEIQWIKDPYLLSQIATAYSRVRMMQTYADRFFQLLELHQFDPDRQNIRWTEQNIMASIPIGSEVVKQALQAIEEAQKS